MSRQSTNPNGGATRRAIPTPFDQYSWDGVVDPKNPLDSHLASIAISASPRGARITGARPHRRWDGTITFPIFVDLDHDGVRTTVVIRADRFRDGVRTEAKVLPLLHRIGLPVPQLLAGPFLDCKDNYPGGVSVLSTIPGSDLLSVAESSGPEGIEALGQLLVTGVDLMHRATDAVRGDTAGRELSAMTLRDELEAIRSRGGPWFSDKQFLAGMRQLLPLATADEVPLVFSNGDYNPSNFLTSGGRLTGIVDFALARFEDPYYGYAKYWTYGMRPFHQAGVIERALRPRLSEARIALRIGINVLWALQREVPVEGHDADFGRYRGTLRSLLGRSLDVLSKA